MNDQRMIGHYRVIELLGTGAMGTVHIALDTFIERPVAIKSLRPELTQDPEFVSRFRAEAKSSRAPQSPQYSDALFVSSGRLGPVHGHGVGARTTARRRFARPRETSERQAEVSPSSRRRRTDYHTRMRWG